MQIIEGLKSEHIEGLSWWFWFRENVAFINYRTVEHLEGYRHVSLIDFSLRDVGFLFIGMPTAYMLGFIIGPRLRLKEAREAVSIQGDLMVYNEYNIGYFTILTMLS